MRELYKVLKNKTMDAVMLPKTKLKRLIIIGGGFGGKESRSYVEQG